MSGADNDIAQKDEAAPPASADKGPSLKWQPEDQGHSKSLEGTAVQCENGQIVSTQKYDVFDKKSMPTNADFYVEAQRSPPVFPGNGAPLIRPNYRVELGGNHVTLEVNATNQQIEKNGPLEPRTEPVEVRHKIASGGSRQMDILQIDSKLQSFSGLAGVKVIAPDEGRADVKMEKTPNTDKPTGFKVTVKCPPPVM